MDTVSTTNHGRMRMGLFWPIPISRPMVRLTSHPLPSSLFRIVPIRVPIDFRVLPLVVCRSSTFLNLMVTTLSCGNPIVKSILKCTLWIHLSGCGLRRCTLRVLLLAGCNQLSAARLL
uniref:Uncharacterized protein n=1 Tax=Arundo donax TaxID=35708 RepID=A0A0A9G768_ARUDO